MLFAPSQRRLITESLISFILKVQNKFPLKKGGQGVVICNYEEPILTKRLKVRLLFFKFLNPILYCVQHTVHVLFHIPVVKPQK